MKSQGTLIIAVAAGLLQLSTHFTNAQTVLINENWGSYSVGSAPAAPWQNLYGGGTTPSASQDSIQQLTIASTTSNWALIGNNATNEPVSNPLLQRGFTSSNVLNISFSFVIPQNYGNSSQQFLTLGYTNGTNTQTALRNYLGANYQGATALGYQTSSGSRVNVGPAFVGGSQVNVAMTNISKSAGTFDLAWTITGGTSGSLTGLALTGSTANDWNFIAFGESSGVASTSQLYVDNIVVQSVPEPGKVALLIGGGLVFLLKRKRTSAA